MNALPERNVLLLRQAPSLIPEARCDYINGVVYAVSC